MRKYSNIMIIVLLILITIICFMLVKNIRNTNVFTNYFILNYLDKMDETMTDMSLQLNEINSEENFFIIIKNYHESIKKDCFLSRKLKVINQDYSLLDLNDFSVYLSDILGCSDLLTEDDIKYHISNLQEICLIFESLSESSDFYTYSDYSNDMAKYKLERGYEVYEKLTDSFTKIKKISISGIESIN